MKYLFWNNEIRAFYIIINIHNFTNSKKKKNCEYFKFVLKFGKIYTFRNFIFDEEFRRWKIKKSLRRESFS